MNFYEYPQCQEYSCIHTPYNDSTFYETLESSGSLSLGTTAGTNRSISAEFSDSAPHGISEFYDKAEFETCGRGNNYSSYVTFPMAVNGTGLSEVSLPASGSGYQYPQAYACGCPNNGKCSGIASGAHKFSDFYGDARTYPVHQICFCMWECAEVTISYGGVGVTLPHTCIPALIASSYQLITPTFYYNYASTSSYVKATWVYTNAQGTVYKTGTLKFHGGSS